MNLTIDHPPGAMATEAPDCAVLEVTVHSHPGVLAQVCGLFSRRAYHLEAMLCVPAGHERRIWLLVSERQRLAQLEQQLLKLQDVRGVRRHGADRELFVRLGELLK